MAYTHSKYEVQMMPVMPTLAVTTRVGGAEMHIATTVCAEWSPGFVPHIIRGAAIKHVGATVVAGDSFGVNFTADLTTPGTPTSLFKIGMPSGFSHNSIYHVPSYLIEIKPGQTVRMNPTAAATKGVAIQAILYVEPRWEEPGNITGMTLTT